MFCVRSFFLLFLTTFTSTATNSNCYTYNATIPYSTLSTLDGVNRWVVIDYNSNYSDTLFYALVGGRVVQFELSNQEFVQSSTATNYDSSIDELSSDTKKTTIIFSIFKQRVSKKLLYSKK